MLNNEEIKHHSLIHCRVMLGWRHQSGSRQEGRQAGGQEGRWAGGQEGRRAGGRAGSQLVEIQLNA